MNRKSENLYKTARKQCGMTAADAAERLYIAERTLYTYEKNRLPPPEVVANMAVVYSKPSLIPAHAEECGELLCREYFPGGFIERSVASNTLGVVAELNVFRREYIEPLIEIAQDGLITENEAVKWEEIKSAAVALTSALIMLQYSSAAKEVKHYAKNPK